MLKSYKEPGFESLSIDEMIVAKVTATTPAFIRAMKEKGHNPKSIDKYIQLKTLVD